MNAQIWINQKTEDGRYRISYYATIFPNPINLTYLITGHIHTTGSSH